MKRLELPAIVETAKKRPLSINPETGAFIYYENVQNGNEKIIPIEKLDHDDLIKLAVKRTLTDEPNKTMTLNGEVYTNADLAKEIESQTKIGRQMFNADIDYLKYYLSQFPEDSMEK